MESRQVDGDAERLREIHRTQFRERLLEDELREVRNHRTIFHVTDKLPGRHQTPLRMLPAHQRLGTHPLPSRHVDDGLIDDKELVTLQASPDPPDQAPRRRKDGEIATHDRRTQKQAEQRSRAFYRNQITHPPCLIASYRYRKQRIRRRVAGPAHARRGQVDAMTVAGKRAAVRTDGGRRLCAGHGPAHKQVFNINAWDNEADPGVPGRTIVDDHRWLVRV